MSRCRTKKNTRKKHDGSESAKERDKEATITWSVNSARQKPASSDDHSPTPTSPKSPKSPKSLREKKLDRQRFRDASLSIHSSDTTADSGEISLDNGEITEEDEGEVGLNDEGSGRMRPRRSSLRENSTSAERPQRRPRRTSSMHETSSPHRTAAPSRRLPRKTNSAALHNMVLGDPSRRAPPSRSKSIDLMQGGDFSRKPPSRSQSNDIVEFLRLKGLQPVPKVSTHAKTPAKIIPKITAHTSAPTFNSFSGDEEEGNPFEVTFQSNRKPSSDFNDTFDPFSADVSDDGTQSDDPPPKEQRSSMTPAKTGGLLMASTRDTMSRGKHPKSKIKKVEINKIEEEKPSEEDAKAERAKQRRAEYKKSIAAAQMAGRRQHAAPRASKIV